jgi:ABC-type multidrug transport system ATPase subunit
MINYWFKDVFSPTNILFFVLKEFVEQVMKLVELDSLRHAIVGMAGTSGLSTEQRKRLTIAVELVANPSIIFMDEPTSGLDARAAAIVMRTVRNTVDTGRTVVCTIHQPSIDIFEAFDEVSCSSIVLFSNQFNIFINDS